MDLRYTADDQAFRAKVREWLVENVPHEQLESLEQKRSWHQQLYHAGYIGMNWPRVYGGRECRPMEQAIASEELARTNAPAPINYMGIFTAGPAIIHHGTDTQKDRYLRNILLAEEIWCQLFSEPNAGSDLASLSCRADIDGDAFVINGQKTWTSSADEADWGLLLVRTDRDARKHQGISCLLVDMRTPGVEVRPLRQISGTNEFSEVFFTDVRVPADNLVGELNDGWRVAQTPLLYERGADTLMIVTRLQQQFNRVLDATRVLQRDGRPALDDPVIRTKLGGIAARIEGLRYASLRLLSQLEKGVTPGPEASLTKLHWTELDKDAQEIFLDILGPFAQQLDGVPPAYALDIGNESGDRGDWPYFFAWSRAGTIYAGSSEIQKNIIGERVLGLPKEARADRISSA